MGPLKNKAWSKDESVRAFFVKPPGAERMKDEGNGKRSNAQPCFITLPTPFPWGYSAGGLAGHTAFLQKGYKEEGIPEELPQQKERRRIYLPSFLPCPVVCWPHFPLGGADPTGWAIWPLGSYSIFHTWRCEFPSKSGRGRVSKWGWEPTRSREDGHSQGDLRKHMGSQQAQPQNPFRGDVSVDALGNWLQCVWNGSERHTSHPCPQGTIRKSLQCEKHT